MHSSGSFILTALERIRTYVDEPDYEAKFSNDFVVRHFLAPAADEVLSRVVMTEEGPFIARLTISLVKDQEYYTLPPIVQEVLRVARYTTPYRYIEEDWTPNSDLSPCGPGWILDGNTIRFTPVPQEAQDWVLTYIPTPMAHCHYSLDGGEANSATSATTFTLDSAPDLGILDRRPNAYIGYYLRILQASGVWSEHMISAYDTATRVCSLRTPILNLGATTAIRYEVAPPLNQSLWEAIALRSAFKVAVGRRLPANVQQGIMLEYNAALKTTRDKYSVRQSRQPRARDQNTIDNEPWESA